MSLYSIPSEQLVNSSDSKIGGFIIAFAFLAISGLILGYIVTTVQLDSVTTPIVLLSLLVLGVALVLVLAIISNLISLKLMVTHAYRMIQIGYGFGFGAMALLLIILGFLFLSSSLGIILIIIGFAIIGAGFLIWKFLLRSRIQRAAQWISISATIVRDEPGMLLISFVQSLIISIGGITEVVLISSIQGLNISQENAGIVIYVVAFFYLWFTLFVTYFFDSVNIFVSYARIKGVDPKIGQGISAASSKVLAILGFSLISTIVYFITTLIRSAIQDRFSDSGSNIGGAMTSVLLQFVVSMVEYMYRLISFFTLPIIVIRNKGAIDAMKESYGHFKSNFWDLVLGDMGFSWGIFSFYLTAGVISGGVGFIYGLILVSIVGGITLLLGAVITALIAFGVGILVTVLFVRPLYNAFVTTFYIYASEGPQAIKNAPQVLTRQISTSLTKAKAKKGKGKSLGI